MNALLGWSGALVLIVLWIYGGVKLLERKARLEEAREKAWQGSQCADDDSFSLPP